MRLVNHLNEVLEIKVDQYTYENIENLFPDSDALDATFSIEKGEIRFKRELKFLLIEELELLDKWFTLVSTSAKHRKSLKFLDVDLECKRYTRGNILYMKIVFSDYYEESTREPISWDFIINKKNVHLMSMEIQKTLKEFPCRCGMEHDCFKLLED